MIVQYGGYMYTTIRGGGDGIHHPFNRCYGEKENVENFMKVYFFIGMDYLDTI